jgi:TonB-linked SusC/RagA family outer membrane protein
MKRNFTISGLVLLCFFFINSAFAQNVTVKGKVTDAANGEALIGVSVGVKGTSTGTQTDVNGAFSLNVSSNATLVFSYIGYTALEVPINGQTSLSVKLQAQSSSLQEVVVVGYGTQKKIDVTGSVASVKGDDIAKQASVNPVSALQGKVAGVSIVNSGAPGASPQITIRGTGTIFGNTGVLYVVDGVWYDDISFLNPADIDNISILKDASSTAIYGIRAANGVVLITTRKGKKGSTTVNYNGYAGWQTVTNPVKMANATEYATLINELYQANNVTPVLFSNPASFGKGTDWYGQILHDAFVTNHEVSINGGEEKSDYNLSIGYLDQNGNVKTNNYQRYTLHLVNNYQPFKNLKLGVSASGLYGTSRDINGGIFHQLYGAAPVLPVFYADGSYGDPNDYNLGGGNNYNPQATLDFFDQHSKNYRFTGNAYAQLTFLKSFTFKTSFGGDFGENEVINYNPIYKATLAQQNTTSMLTRSRAEVRNWLAENTLTYDNTFGKDHHVTVLLGQSAERRQGYGFTGTAQNVPAGSQSAYFGLGNNYNIVDGGSLNTFVSYFGRVNYAYKDKYLFNASIRDDGASQFYPKNTYTILPSVGAGWVITQEDFMKGQHMFDLLKLRGSWGRVANAGVPFNVTVPTTITDPSFLTAIFGGVPYIGTNVNTITPPSIVVERAEGTDIGLEGALFNNHLSFEADYYNRLTKDAVFAIPVLASLGTSGSVIGNQADIRNRGFELLVTWKGNINKDFSYSVSGNIGINNNKVLRVSTGANPIYGGGNGITNGALATRTVLGQPIGEFYGYKVAGIFQSTADVASYAKNGTPIQPNAKPGDFKYADVNNDGVIDGRDRVVLGDPNPKYNYGFNTSFTYKSFDLALDFQGVAGVSVYNANIAYRYGNENFTQDFYNNRWHGSGTSNTYPSADVGSNANAAPNSFFVESGAYFRLRNAQLGYTLPGSILSKVGVKKVRFYANAQNPINIFKYKGFSPEVGGSPTNAGIDANVYPLYATYNFGVNVTF